MLALTDRVILIRIYNKTDKRNYQLPVPKVSDDFNSKRSMSNAVSKSLRVHVNTSSKIKA